MRDDLEMRGEDSEVGTGIGEEELKRRKEDGEDGRGRERGFEEGGKWDSEQDKTNFEKEETDFEEDETGL